MCHFVVVYVKSLINFCSEMPASEQLKEVPVEADRTEYKIVDLKSDTKYIVYLLARTVADGEKDFVEDSTNALGGVVCCYLCCITDVVIMLSLFMISLH